MSRIGNFPIEVPTGVEVQFSPSEISVKGPLGTLKQPLSEQVTLEKIENRLQFKVANESHAANALSGTMRALVANMVQGVTKGYERKLMLVGVGYRAQAQGDCDDGSHYYRHWLDALEQMLIDQRLASAQQIHALEHAWEAAAARTPHGQPVTL